MDAPNKNPGAGRQNRGFQKHICLNYTPAEDFLRRLDGVRQTAHGWLARCPSHDDRSPSLSIRETGEGLLLVHCFAGCSIDAICAAVGLSTADLFPRRHGRDFDPTAPRPKRPRFSAGELLPLVVTEALILSLAWRSVANGEMLSEADMERTELAEKAVMAAWREVRHA